MSPVGFRAYWSGPTSAQYVTLSDPVELELENGRRLELSLTFKFTFREEGGGGWKATTDQYIYWIHVAGADPADPSYRLLNWHFHPNLGRPDPHLHVGVEANGVLLTKTHLPTDFLPFEAIIKLLIEMGVPARFSEAEWRTRLEESLALFRRSHKWPW